MKKYFLSLYILFVFSAVSSSAQVYINEWMASNSSVINDPDFGDSGDWIEIYNDDNDTLDLTGYFLTDNLNSPSKWTFPTNRKIPPYGFLLIWADGKDTLLHTNFGLARLGEEIGLFSPDTVLLDAVEYPVQGTNISMGRITDGADSLGFFDMSTPGASNSTQSFTGLTYFLPQFSIKGGFYSGSIQVALSSIDGAIRYTLDGSLPTLNSPLYSSPITISQTTNLRARVFINNQIPSKPVTHTYFFNQNFETRNLPVISITTDSSYFWDENIGLYVQSFKPSWEYPINIELFENDGSNRAAFNELAGTRVNGQNSWVLPQKMLGIYFDNDYDKNNLEYQLFFDRDRARFDNFTLRAGGSDWSYTIFRDGLSQSLTAENMDIERMAFRPAIAFVNGKYMGIHNMRSRVDEGFIEENFGYAGDEYDLIENNGVVEQGDIEDWNELFALFQTDLSIPANFQAVANVMDIQNFTDYFITEIWSSNGSYGHNIKIWKPKEDSGKWRWILQDLDRGFTGASDHKINYFEDDGVPASYNWARIALRSMLENDDFADQFMKRFTDHLYTTFHPNTVSVKIREFKETIDQEMPYHSARWAGTTSSYGNGISSVAFWEKEVSKLYPFATERQDVMIRDLKARFGLSEAVNIGLEVYPAEAGYIELNHLKVPESTWNGPYFPNLPLELKAEANPGHQFQGWSKASYETLIDKKSSWKYLDDGSNQWINWIDTTFDDSNWSSGMGEFGYGDNDETTVVSFGPNSNSKFITTYFRKSFTFQNIADYSGKLLLHLLRDDGAVVYLNGEEILRTNMPDGAINYNSQASTFIGAPGEFTYYPFLIEADQLKEGENILAVEIHQFNGGSSDMSFDLSLQAIKTGNGGIISTNETLPITLSQDTFLIANYTSTGECVLPKAITQNMTLKLDCSPYLAPHDITVFENVSLTIEPGVEIHFSKDADLIVHGDLQVEGKDTAQVVFKPIDGVEQWGAVIFHSTTDTSRLNWLEISGASKGDHPIYENAAISGFYADLKLDHLKIVDVFSNPILGYYSNITLTNSELHSRVTGDLINVKYGYGYVENCDFEGNDQVDTDAIDYDEVENGIIRNNKIYNFWGFNSDGIDLGEESKNVLIEGNFIHNCTDKGVSVGQKSTIILRDNIIVNCDIGIAVKDESFAEIDQNTFYNIATPVVCYEKNLGIGGGTGLVSNSILSNSIDFPFEVDEYSMLMISNSLSDTDSLPGIDNVFANPLFENPVLHDFSLQSSSPAQNAGVDDQGNSIALGAKSHIYTGLPSIMITGINYHPENDGDAEYIEIYNASDSMIDLKGYALSEAVDFVFPDIQIQPQQTRLIVKEDSFFSNPWTVSQWTLGRLSNGGETIKLADSYGIVIDQVTYDNKAPWPTDADGKGDALTLKSMDLDNHFAESWTEGLPVSIEQNNLEEQHFTIFPNPAQDYVEIQSIQTPIKEIRLMNLWGQIVMRKSFSASLKVHLTLSNLPKGMYFLKINDEEIGRKVFVE